jgi:F-type H+-transporting ATPase subunit gamma
MAWRSFGVSEKRKLRAQIRGQRDLRHVVEAMQNLALAEIARLTRTAQARRTLLDNLDDIAKELVSFYPPLFVNDTSCPTLYILIGSERGLCGDLNENIARLWRSTRSHDGDRLQHQAIVVGTRLSDKLEADRSIRARLPGPTTGIEIDPVLTEVVSAIAAFIESLGAASYRLIALYTSASGICETLILPLTARGGPARSASPPDINLTPHRLIREFIDYYVDAALHELFSTSLVSENRLRLERMTKALEHIDKSAGGLIQRLNRVRQEDITQEIETILLSVNLPGISTGDRYAAFRGW